MKKLLWAIAMAVALLSCGHSVKPYYYVKTAEPAVVPVKIYHVWVDKQFGEMDRIAIDNSVRQWNYALNGYVKIVVDSYVFDMESDVLSRVMRGEGWVILKIRSDNPLVAGVDRPAKPGEQQYYTLAWVNEIGGNRMWVVRNRIDNSWMQGVMLHEMGHLLGSGHDNVYLMQPHFNWEDYRCVDYQALKRVAEYQVIPLGRLNYCEYGDSVKLPSAL